MKNVHGLNIEDFFQKTFFFIIETTNMIEISLKLEFFILISVIYVNEPIQRKRVDFTKNNYN